MGLAATGAWLGGTGPTGVMLGRGGRFCGRGLVDLGIGAELGLCLEGAGGLPPATEAAWGALVAVGAGGGVTALAAIGDWLGGAPSSP